MLYDHSPNFIEAKFYKDLYEKRIISIFNPIDAEVARWTVFGIKELNRNGNGDITIYINSPGGLAVESWKIIKEMMSSKINVATLNLKIAAGMAAFILMAGKEGKRFALKNATAKITKFEGGIGTEQDYDSVLGLKQLAKDRLKIGSRQFYDIAQNEPIFTAKEQLKIGIIDGVISR
jgi:ATP-dependent Clp protease, protease subunit